MSKGKDSEEIIALNSNPLHETEVKGTFYFLIGLVLGV